MNIQIFGKSKCFDTKKAQRWFKERRIPFQMIDLPRYGMSGREFESVLRAVGGVEMLADWSKQDPELDLMRYLERESDRADHLFERMDLVRTPVVRNGKQATVGYCPVIWAQWN